MSKGKGAPGLHLLGQEWDSYRITLLRGAGAVQVQETRRAFYAGAAAFLQPMTGNLTPGDEPQPADEAMMEGLHAELVAFSRAVAAGRA